MSKVQWLGDPCHDDQSNRDKCAAFATSVATATGAYGAAQFFRDQCLDYLCSTGSMPSSSSDLPKPPPVYEPYPWGVYDPGTVVLQKELNKQLKADGLCPLNEDGKVGAGTCGAAKKYGVNIPSCAGKPATAPTVCGATPAPSPSSPTPVVSAGVSEKGIPTWAKVVLIGGAVVGVIVLGEKFIRGGTNVMGSNPYVTRRSSRPSLDPDVQGAFERGLEDGRRDRAPIFRKVGKHIEPTVDDPGADSWTTKMRMAYLEGYDSVMGSNPRKLTAKPDKQGRHPKYKHLVMFEIEPHYGSYILTAVGHRGDALISSDDAQHMFGKDFEAGFGYLTDEYLQLLEKQ